MKVPSKLAAVALAAALALGFAACSPVVDAAAPAPTSDVVVATHAPTPAAASGEPTHSPESTTEVATAAGQVYFNGVAGGCGADGYAVDSGPAPMANDTVETDAEGRPIAYVVAEGDAPQAIQERICLTNLLERNGLNGYIQPGDRLTIDPTVPIP
ncbi:MAG: hypothetical protein ABS62_11175 [Microbacterium sp. SCN 70-200]|uniref:hypothetical protein n=1 Tax=unclassified Microbacterium TaxID=2609290 RepID=UPI000869FA21|nr:MULTISPECIES: hypothetical protein [unclassified Microbacterium]MBN9213755.1 hypothetical protein [Microbacterium sp.]ODT40051.1 MAG: hypothetical protein ABS62_11175 [Microbacterium sp. SCN 70-200]OJV79261.1 MAG: hypothetical protein BGO46_03110 [Microbacterium sp. 70-16]